jgi:ribosomal protein L39E
MTEASTSGHCGASATCVCAVALLLGLVLAPVGRAYATPTRLNDVARFYSLGVGEVRCASAAEWGADAYSKSYWGYTNVAKDYSILAPDVCEGALSVASRQVPAWQRAVGTLVLVHEAFHLRHWRFRRDEGKVECQTIVYFTEAAQKLGASEAEANDLYSYALAWHWRRTQLLPWYRDPTCLIPPWIPPTP